MKANFIHFLILISIFLIVFGDDKDDVVVLKNRAWEGYQTNIGAHYYAYSPYTTEYSIVTSFIKLPNKINTNGGNRKAYISLGVLGLHGSIELGIVNSGKGWCPYSYDPNKKNFQEYKGYFAPSGTEIVGIQLEVTTNRVVIFSLTFRKSSLEVINLCQFKINASHILVYENNKVKFRFFRFAKMLPTGLDDQNDGTYMIGGQFTELTIVKNDIGLSWGIDSDDIDVAWQVSHKRIQFSYDDKTDRFDIRHEKENEKEDGKLTDEEIEVFKNLPELRFSSLSIKLKPNEDSIKLKMKIPFEDCFDFFSPNKNEIEIYLYSTSGDLINLKPNESCFSFKNDEIIYVYIKAKLGGNIHIPMKFRQYKNYLPYQPIEKEINYDISDNNKFAEPFEIKYEKRKGEALYINCNNPEVLYEQNINKPIIRNQIINQEVFFTMEHNCQYQGGYMGYRLKNTGDNDLYVTVRNLGYYIAKLNGDWTGQKEWVDFYNVNFRFRNQEKWSNEELNQLKTLVREEYTANPRVPVTYRIPPGKYIYILGGTSEDAYNNINVFETADQKIDKGIVNGVVLFDVKGKAEANLYYYTNYRDINENDRSTEILINGFYDNNQAIGAQYKGYDECHGVIDGYAFWKFNDKTPSQFLPVKIINYYREGESLINQEPYSEILDTTKHEYISNLWITNSNPQKFDAFSKVTIGSDLTDFNIYKADLNYIKIDNYHYDGRGRAANTANWMVNYITSYYLVNLGETEREVTVTITGYGVIACLVVNSGGHIVGESEQFSLYDKETGKELIHEFSYTTKIQPKGEARFYVEHTLLANSYGKVTHKAFLK